ncbi:MAG: oxidoreductase [Microbacter sp.]
MNKVILITGASSGIGKETAVRLVRKGFTVYGAARRLEKMSDLQALGVHVLKMDVTDDASMVNGLRYIMDHEGRIDVLINNAGYGSFGAVEDVPIEEARTQFEVNLFGLARLTQLVLPTMRAQKGGRIINVSSVAGTISEPFGAWYHASKFALEGWSDCLRMELIPMHIDVVIIKPAMIQTEWSSIARENLLKTSGQGFYRHFARQHAAMLGKGDAMIASKPVVIAKIIEKAVLARKPKTRYAAGKGAHLMIWIRRHVPDRLFDAMMLKMLNMFSTPQSTE